MPQASGRRSWALCAKGLWVEHGDRELIVDQITLHDLLDLLSGNFSDALKLGFD